MAGMKRLSQMLCWPCLTLALAACSPSVTLPPAGSALGSVNGKLLAQEVPMSIGLSGPDQSTASTGDGSSTGSDTGNVTTKIYAQVKLGGSRSFSLKLPDGAALPLSPADQAAGGFGCSGADVSSSDKDALAYAATELTGIWTTTVNQQQVISRVESYIAIDGTRPEVFLPSVDVVQYALIYADRSTRLSGSLDCAAKLGVPQLKVTVAAELKPGWNSVGLHLKAKQTTSLNTSGELVAADPGTTSWMTQDQFQRSIPRF